MHQLTSNMNFYQILICSSWYVLKHLKRVFGLGCFVLWFGLGFGFYVEGKEGVFLFFSFWKKQILEFIVSEHREQLQ